MNAAGSVEMNHKDTQGKPHREGKPPLTRCSLSFSVFSASLWFFAFPPGGLAPTAAQTALPRINQISPIGAQRGATIELTVTGVNVGRGTALLFEGTGLSVESVKAIP